MKTKEIKNHQIEEILNVPFEELEKQTREFTRLMSYYKCAMMEVETKFNVLNEEFSLQHDRNPISTIKSRLKKPSSMKEKLTKRGIPCTVKTIQENLNDVAGVRVCCSFTEDVYMLANALLNQDDLIFIVHWVLSLCSVKPYFV